MRLNHIVAALAVAACLSFASSAVAEHGFATHICEFVCGGGCSGGTTELTTAEQCLQHCRTECKRPGTTCEPPTVCIWLGEDILPPPICGDGTINQESEECDPPQDGACPGECIPESCLCPPPPPVPAVSAWGIASLGLLLLAGLTIKFRGALPKRA